MRRVILLPGRPDWLPPESKPRGLKAAGLSFEREAGDWLARHCPTMLRNPWLEYGRGKVCSPDFVLHVDGRTLIGECKLTAKRGSFGKLLRLYLPLGREIWGPGCEAFGIARNVVAKGNKPVWDWKGLLAAPASPSSPLRLLVLP